MNPVNPIFAIGTIGLIVTATLHIALAFVLSEPVVHISFLVMYPVYGAFLFVGFQQILQSHRIDKHRR